MSTLQHSGQLLLLSDELLVDILSLLSSGLDLLSCSLSCTRLARLAQDKKALQNVNFRQELGMTSQKFSQFFLSPAVCANTRGINLNSTYWLNSSLVFSTLMKITNLKILHIADIQLTSHQFSSIISKLSKLEALSFTWTWTTEAKAKEVSASSLSHRLSELSSLNMYISTPGICPLDKVAWMLEHCTGLKHLAIFSSQFLYRRLATTTNCWRIIPSIKEMKFPKLKSLILDMKNRDFTRKQDFVTKIFAGVDAGNITKFWCSSEHDNYTKREFIGRYTTSLELLTLCSPQPALSLPEPMSARQASLSFSCAQEIFDHLCIPCPGLRKLSLHLRPCHAANKRLGHNCHIALAKTIEMKPEVLEGLEELSYSINGLEGKGESRDCLPLLMTAKMLAQLKFQNLLKLAMPLCAFLSNPDQKYKFSLSPKSRRKKGSHDAARLSCRFSNTSFLVFVDNVPGLEHLEIVSCPDLLCAKVGAEEILEAVPKLSKLKTLILSKVVVNFISSKPLFQRIFSSCPELSHLHLNSLVCDVQQLCKDLVLGLKQAQSLSILKLFQKQWTQHSKSLLAALLEDCNQLKQLLIIDSSKDFTLKQFPLAELVKIAQKESMCFLYITSELLTTENIKKLKSSVQKLSVNKPYFVSRFVKEFVDIDSSSFAFFREEYVAKLPMVYHRSVTSIDSCSYSSVANLTIEDIF